MILCCSLETKRDTDAWRSFFVQFFCLYLPPLLNIFCLCYGHIISVLYWAHLCMKYSFGISNFLEKISSLSHSIAFLYCFALSAKEGFHIFPCYSLELCIQMGISFLFFFANCFPSFHSYLWGLLRQPFCFFLHFFFLGVILITVSCTMSWTSACSLSGTVSIRYSPLNLFLTFTVKS